MYKNVLLVVIFLLTSDLSAMETKRVVAGAKEQIKQLTEQEQQLLSAAAKGGKEGLETIKGLIDKYGFLGSYNPQPGALNLDVQDAQGNTALILAAQHEHPEIVTYLLEISNVAARQERSEVEIYLVLSSLVDNTPNRRIQNKDGKTALMFAAGAQSEKAETMVRALLSWRQLQRCQYEGLTDNQKRTALFYAVQGKNLAVIKLLYMKAQYLVNMQDNDGLTPLMVAAEEGYADIVQFLLDNGAKPELKDKSGRTALDRAKRAGHEKVITLFDKKHAQKLGEELGKAIFVKDKDKIRALLKQGADVNTPFYAYPLLSWSISLELYEFVPDFIKAGANLNVQDKDAETVLMSAAIKGATHVVQQLLEAGADATIRHWNGKTAADFARQKGHTGLADLLDEAAKKQLAAKSAGAAGEAKGLG